jgi:hypothetical protein
MARSTAFNSRRPLTAPFGYLSTAQYKIAKKFARWRLSSAAKTQRGRTEMRFWLEWAWRIANPLKT